MWIVEFKTIDKNVNERIAVHYNCKIRTGDDNKPNNNAETIFFISFEFVLCVSALRFCNI